MSEPNDALSIFQRHMQTQADLSSLAQSALVVAGGPMGLVEEMWEGAKAAGRGSMAHATLVGRLADLVVKDGEKRKSAPAGSDMDQEQILAVLNQLVPLLKATDGQANP